MKKIFLYFLVLSVLAFGGTQTTYAWLGLIGQNGDIISVSKWNEMINKLNLKLEQSNILGSSNIEVTPSGTGVVISFTGALTTEPIPFILGPSSVGIGASSSKDIIISGLNFTPTTTITIPGWPGSINSTTIDSPEKLTINITSDSTIADYDLVINNGTVPNTLWTGNGVDMIKVLTLGLWKDLRLGGDVFTDGTGAGNDIRYKAGMTLSRDANGMHFSGVSPWSSRVKFESLAWTRGDNKTIEWIFTQPTSAMMIGIGSDATNETSTAQYIQAELVAYFQNSTTMWGFYGNNGTPGTTGNQGSSATLSGCASQVFKTKITNDGTVGPSIFTLYCLPSASSSDWDDETVVLSTATIGGTINPDEAHIMPFIIPVNGSTQRFIAVKVQ